LDALGWIGGDLAAEVHFGTGTSVLEYELAPLSALARAETTTTGGANATATLQCLKVILPEPISIDAYPYPIDHVWVHHRAAVGFDRYLARLTGVEPTADEAANGAQLGCLSGAEQALDFFRHTLFLTFAPFFEQGLRPTTVSSVGSACNVYVCSHFSQQLWQHVLLSLAVHGSGAHNLM
jgi:hypothetical protein